MKTTRWILTLLAICVVGAAGCKKSEDAPGPVPVYYGVKMEHLPKLDTEFATASQDVQASATAIKRFLRSAQLPQAMAELVKLSKNPNLTEPQKQVISGLSEETKQVIANSMPPGR